MEYGSGGDHARRERVRSGRVAFEDPSEYQVQEHGKKQCPKIRKDLHRKFRKEQCPLITQSGEEFLLPIANLESFVIHGPMAEYFQRSFLSGGNI